jgi:hypothetical protein
MQNAIICKNYNVTRLPPTPCCPHDQEEHFPTGVVILPRVAAPTCKAYMRTKQCGSLPSPSPEATWTYTMTPSGGCSEGWHLGFGRPHGEGDPWRLKRIHHCPFVISHSDLYRIDLIFMQSSYKTSLRWKFTNPSSQEFYFTYKYKKKNEKAVKS